MSVGNFPAPFFIDLIRMESSYRRNPLVNDKLPKRKYNAAQLVLENVTFELNDGEKGKIRNPC
ncbi:hypothetical protein PATA110616_06550 [Paenibacillus tarimensis]